MTFGACHQIVTYLIQSYLKCATVSFTFLYPKLVSNSWAHLYFRSRCIDSKSAIPGHKLIFLLHHKQKTFWEFRDWSDRSFDKQGSISSDQISVSQSNWINRRKQWPWLSSLSSSSSKENTYQILPFRLGRNLSSLLNKG